MLQKLSLFNEDDVESPEQGLTWSRFYQTITSWLEEFYPMRTITITSRDPEFITPEIKILAPPQERCHASEP